MRTNRSVLVTLLTLVCCLPAAAQVVPIRSEVGVTPSNGRHHLPSVALVDGGSLVAWTSDEQGVMGRRYDATDAARGDSFVLVASDAIPPLPFVNVIRHVAREPFLAARADGSFLLVWTDRKISHSADILYENQSLIASQVMARFFDASGTPASAQWTLSNVDANAERPRAVVTGDKYVVTWQEKGGASPGVHLRSVDRQSGPGDDTLAGPRGLRPALGAAGDRVMVAWERCCGTRGNQIFARFFDARGRAAGGQFKVAEDRPLGARAPSVAGQPGGDFLVAYQRPRTDSPRNTWVYGQLIGKRGTLVGGEMTLSSGFGDAHSAAVAVALANRGWAVGWMTWVGSFRAAASVATFGPLLNGLGTPVELNDLGPVAGLEMGLTASADGRLLGAWEGYDEHGPLSSLRAREAQAPTH